MDFNITEGVDVPIDVIHADLTTFRTDDIDADAVAPEIDTDIDTLLSGYEMWVESEGHPKSTSSTYRRGVKHYFWILHHDDGNTVTDIEPSRVKDYLKVMATPSLATDTDDDTDIEPYADNTIRGRHAGIKRFYDWLGEQSNGATLDNPADITIDFLENKTKKEQELNDAGFFALTPDQKDRLANNVESPAMRNELLIRLAYQTGARVSELVVLELEDIDTSNRTVDIPAIKSKGRTVPYDQQLDTLLDTYLNERRTALPGVPESNPYIFPSQEGNRSEKGKYEHITESHANAVVVEAADNAGLRREYGTDKRGYTKTVPTMHTLRHAYAVQSIKNGMNLRDLQIALGHSDIRNTLEYLKALKQGRTERLRKHSAGPTNDDAEIARTQVDIDPSVLVGHQ
ncbi:tyrosine-type recombinase/integrase [Halosimplex marinum]|uniref:tyrosine-type recombinase/integrase n=1 Tax=Halosimplex marinum TaxID=3396620 RepID=UPI003F57A979